MILRLFPLLLGAGLLVNAGALPSPFALYLHDVTGKSPDTLLGQQYQIADTPQGGVTSLVLKLVNTSNNAVNVVAAVVGTDASSPSANTNFTLTGLAVGNPSPPGQGVYFTVSFAPTTTGTITGYLNVYFEYQASGCLFNTGTCPNGYSSILVVTGTATAPQLVLSYASQPLQPATSAPLNLGTVTVGKSITATFTLSNEGSAPIATPSISLIANLNAISPFVLSASQMPSTLNAGASANFTVTFAPAQIGLATVALAVGANQYPLAATGTPSSGVGSLQISYTDSGGVRYSPQLATPISFGQVVASGGTSATLTFSLANPQTSYDPIVVPSVTASGSGFSVSGVPAVPFSISPGNSVSFTATFTPTNAGTYTGTLAIGSLQFSLTGLSVISPLPSFSLQFTGAAQSAQQNSVSVQFSGPAPTAFLGTLTLQFTPSVSGAGDDPAVTFLATSGRQLSLTLPSGSQTAQYNGQTNLNFQTGTTAGTLTFTVTFPNTAPYTQSLTIPAAAIQISSLTAVRQSPNLVVTLEGFDNTLSAGQVSYTFYDTSGNAIGSAISIDASSQFHQLFFNGNQNGGLFSLESTFPVTGDVTQVGSVAVSIANSIGPASAKANFQ